jgi:hypothetical protein
MKTRSDCYRKSGHFRFDRLGDGSKCTIWPAHRFYRLHPGLWSTALWRYCSNICASKRGPVGMARGSRPE